MFVAAAAAAAQTAAAADGDAELHHRYYYFQRNFFVQSLERFNSRNLSFMRTHTHRRPNYRLLYVAYKN